MLPRCTIHLHIIKSHGDRLLRVTRSQRLTAQEWSQLIARTTGTFAGDCNLRQALISCGPHKVADLENDIKSVVLDIGNFSQFSLLAKPPGQCRVS